MKQHNNLNSQEYATSWHKIGQGAQAEVFYAHSKKDPTKQYAIKLYRKQDQEQLNSEITALLKLKDNPNIVKCYGVLKEVKYENKDYYGIVLDYMYNQKAIDFFKDKPHQEQIARYYFRELLTILEDIHSKNIAHCDIKPDNILIDKRNYILKIIDFGLSIIINQSTPLAYLETNKTTLFWPPEIYKKQKCKHQDMDVFALGVSLFAMVTDDYPFVYATQQKDNYKCFKQNKTAFWNHFLAKKKLSKQFMNLIDIMLSPEPKQRKSIKQLKEHRWLTGQAIPSLQQIKGTLKKYYQQKQQAKQQHSQQYHSLQERTAEDYQDMDLYAKIRPFLQTLPFKQGIYQFEYILHLNFIDFLYGLNKLLRLKDKNLILDDSEEEVFRIKPNPQNNEILIIWDYKNKIFEKRAELRLKLYRIKSQQKQSENQHQNEKKEMVKVQFIDKNQETSMINSHLIHAIKNNFYYYQYQHK